MKERYPMFFENKISFNAVIHNRNSVTEIKGYIWNKYGKMPSISEMNLTCDENWL